MFQDMPFLELLMCDMGEGLGKNFHSLELWVNLFLLADLMLMLSQDVHDREVSEQNAHSLEGFFFFFFFVFSAASLEIYKALLKLVRQVPLLPPSQCLCQKTFWSLSLNKKSTQSSK